MPVPKLDRERIRAQARERVRAAQQADRVARAQPRELAEDWRRLVRRWAAERSLDVGQVLDLFDERASMYLYDGADWDEAQARAWDDTCELMTRAA